MRVIDLWPRTKGPEGPVLLRDALLMPATRGRIRARLLIACVKDQARALSALFPDTHTHDEWTAICNEGRVPDWLAKL